MPRRKVQWACRDFTGIFAASRSVSSLLRELSYTGAAFGGVVMRWGLLEVVAGFG